MPNASLSKYTAHLFQKSLKLNNPTQLTRYKVKEPETSYRFWQRDALAILMDSKDKLVQKLDYIHNNPLQEKWNLAETPEDYIWSSASYYETGIDKFGFLSPISDLF